MAVIPWLYKWASRCFRNEPARKLKDFLRPVKHALVGKNGIYKAIEVVGELQKKKGREVKVIFDIGAAIGEAALPMLRAFPGAEVYCFEPLPGSFAKLKERTKCFAERIHYFNYGLYNRSGESKFYVWENHHDGSSVIRPPATQKNREISITVRKLDGVIKELGIKHIDFMKIDVEGAEKEMLGGCEGSLAPYRQCFRGNIAEPQRIQSRLY